MSSGYICVPYELVEGEEDKKEQVLYHHPAQEPGQLAVALSCVLSGAHSALSLGLGFSNGLYLAQRL